MTERGGCDLEHLLKHLHFDHLQANSGQVRCLQCDLKALKLFSTTQQLKTTQKQLKTLELFSPFLWWCFISSCFPLVMFTVVSLMNFVASVWLKHMRWYYLSFVIFWLLLSPRGPVPTLSWRNSLWSCCLSCFLPGPSNVPLAEIQPSSIFVHHIPLSPASIASLLPLEACYGSPEEKKQGSSFQQFG